MTIDLSAMRAFFRQSAFVVDLGFEPVKVEPGIVTSEMAILPRFLQHSGVVHAGVMATVADHTMGSAAFTMAAEGSVILTAELKTSLLRAAKGERLVCEGRVLKPGRNLSFTEAEVWVESNGQRTLVMKASATMAVVSRV
jgi:uncharacterized protein (TIGR00369 family)